MARRRSAAEDPTLSPAQKAARLLDADGHLDPVRFERLTRARDDTLMDLRE